MNIKTGMVALVAMFAAGASPVYGESQDRDFLVKTIYGEARGESFEGMLHVASVIINRKQSGKFPNTIKGVVLQPGQFNVWCKSNNNYRKLNNTNDPAYKKAEKAADHVLENGPINNKYYFVQKHIYTRWCKKRFVVGNHAFC